MTKIKKIISFLLYDEELKKRVEDRLEELDLMNNPLKRKEIIEKEEKIKKNNEFKKTLMMVKEARQFKDIYLKCGEPFQTINNKVTYINTLKDSDAINYLFRSNIKKMNWDLK